MATDNMKHRRLQELGESDFEIVDGQPDIRGWDVKNASGETIGEVDELILDAQARKVRYMVVDLDDDALQLDDDRKVLIPIGLAELHEKEDDVMVPNIQVSQLQQLPAYESDRLDENLESAISSVFGRTGSVTTGDQGFYEHDHFNDQNLYKQRLLPASTTAGSQPYFRDRNTGDVQSFADTRRSEVYDTNSDGAFSEEEVDEETLQPVSGDLNRTDTDRLNRDIPDENTKDAGEIKPRRSDRDRTDSRDSSIL